MRFMHYTLSFTRRNGIYSLFKPGIDRVQALADISRSRYVLIATKPVHRLQILPVAHN